MDGMTIGLKACFVKKVGIAFEKTGV